MTLWILSSSVLILIVATMRILLRGKVAPGLQYALWLLVLIRLLIPGNLARTPLSIANLIPEPTPTAYTQTAAHTTPNPETSPTINITPIDRQNWLDAPVLEIPTSTIQAQDSADGPVAVISAVSLDWRTFLTLLWISGMVVAALVLLVSNLRFYSRLRRSRVPFYTENSPKAFTVKGLSSPCLFGVPIPAIYLPTYCLEHPTAMTHMLVHEQTHYRHGDHVWALLRGIALILHWYNPLVWLAIHLSRQDCELACDAASIRQLGEEQRLAYGKTLVDLIALRPRPVDLLSCATTMNASKRNLTWRVALIAKKPKMLAVTAICILLVAAVAVGCTFTGANVSDLDADQVILTHQGMQVTLKGDNAAVLAKTFDAVKQTSTGQPMGIPGRLTLSFQKDGNTIADWSITPEGICADSRQRGNYHWENNSYDQIASLFWDHLVVPHALLNTVYSSNLTPNLHATQIAEVLNLYRSMELAPISNGPNTATQISFSIPQMQTTAMSLLPLFSLDETGNVTLYWDGNPSYYMCENGEVIYQQLQQIKSNALSYEQTLAWSYISDQIAYLAESYGCTVLDSRLDALTAMTAPDSPYQALILQYRLQPDNPSVIPDDSDFQLEDGWLTGETALGKPVLQYYADNASFCSLAPTWTNLVDIGYGGDYEASVKSAYSAAIGVLSPFYNADSQVLILPWPLQAGNISYRLEGTDGNGTAYSEAFDCGEHMQIDLSQYRELWLITLEDGTEQKRENICVLHPEAAMAEMDYRDVKLTNVSEHLTLEEIGERWFAAWGAKLQAASPLNPALVTAFSVDNCEVVVTPVDGSIDRFCVRTTLHLQDRTADDDISFWIRYHSAHIGTDHWEGWLELEQIAVLERQGTDWHCTSLGRSIPASVMDWGFDASVLDADFSTLPAITNSDGLRLWIGMSTEQYAETLGITDMLESGIIIHGGGQLITHAYDGIIVQLQCTNLWTTEDLPGVGDSIETVYTLLGEKEAVLMPEMQPPMYSVNYILEPSPGWIGYIYSADGMISSVSVGIPMTPFSGTLVQLGRLILR